MQSIKSRFVAFCYKRRQHAFELQKQREKIEAQIDKLTDLLLNDHVTQDAYDRKHSHLLRHLSNLY